MSSNVARITDYEAAILFLRREPLRNQHLVTALEADVPSVPREVYVGHVDDIRAVLVVEHFEYGDGTSSDWVSIDAASEKAASEVLEGLPSEREFKFMIHRSWMKECVQRRFGVQFSGKRYDYTVNEDRFRPVRRYPVTVLDETHLEMLANKPSVTPPRAPTLVDELERQLRGERIRVFVLFQEEGIVAYATAEGLVEDIWGIHPQTLEPHRGKGYGRAVMSAATEHVLSVEKMPYYDAGPDNPSGMRIADALGYWVYQEMIWT